MALGDYPFKPLTFSINFSSKNDSCSPLTKGGKKHPVRNLKLPCNKKKTCMGLRGKQPTQPPNQSSLNVPEQPLFLNYGWQRNAPPSTMNVTFSSRPWTSLKWAEKKNTPPVTQKHLLPTLKKKRRLGKTKWGLLILL